MKMSHGMKPSRATLSPRSPPKVSTRSLRSGEYSPSKGGDSATRPERFAQKTDYDES